MKALVIEGPEKAGYADRPLPEPAGGEVLLRVRRIGYCGSDLNTFRGLNPLVTYPRIPGHEIAGEILAVGAEVPGDFAPGLLVTALPYTACDRCSACLTGRGNACRSNQTLGVQRDGAMAEYLTIPWEKLLSSPHLTELELALVEPLSVGFHAVDRGRVSEADTVLVFGCGMIGLGAISAAGLDRKARVIAVDIDAAKLGLAKQCGATHLIDSSKEPLAETVERFTDGHGPSVVIEAVGLPQTFQAAVNLAAFAGRVVYIGYTKEPVSYDTKYFVLKELDILGSRNATRADFNRVIRMLESKRYPAEATVTHRVAFGEAAEALAGWSRNPGAVTKIHVTFP
jgi:2-desacetyl-2-hydroxyethyl bacteriochlorophyllide A dehydrogenase